jgi:hypothetical protein
MTVGASDTPEVMVAGYYLLACLACLREDVQTLQGLASLLCGAVPWGYQGLIIDLRGI